MINNKGDLDQFKAGNQGTNFVSSKFEYKTILDMVENNYSINQIDRKIWFVCQGSSFTDDQGKKYLFALKEGKGEFVFTIGNLCLKLKKVI